MSDPDNKLATNAEAMVDVAELETRDAAGEERNLVPDVTKVVSWNQLYLGFVESLREYFSHSQALADLATMIRSRPADESFMTAFKHEVKLAMLTEKDTKQLKHLGASFPGIKLDKISRGFTKNELAQFWSNLQLLYASLPGNSTALALTGQDGKSSSAPCLSHSFMFTGFNRLFHQFVEDLCHLFRSSTALAELSEVAQAAGADPCFLNAMQSDISTTEQIEQLKNHDPALLQSLTRTFPNVNLPMMFSKMRPLETKRFWEGLLQLFNVVALYAPMEGSFREIEDITLKMVQEAGQKNINPNNVGELATYVMSELLENNKSSDLIERLHGDLQDPAGQKKFQKFMQLRGINIPMEKLLSGEAITEADKETMLNKISEIHPGSRDVFKDLINKYESQYQL
jgi:hypothetical protein